jgi:hypothetical protein
MFVRVVGGLAEVGARFDLVLIELWFQPPLAVVQLLGGWSPATSGLLAAATCR